jgi:hypothetical protein
MNISTRELSNSLAILPSESSISKAGETGKYNYKFCLTKYVFYTSKGSLTCCKILRHGVYGFTSRFERSRDKEFYRPQKSIAVVRV